MRILIDATTADPSLRVFGMSLVERHLHSLRRSPLEIEEIRVRGSGAQAFKARPVGCTTAPIKAKSSCGVEVRFKPHRGGSFSAEVVLKHSGAEGTSKVELRGLGQV